jgi:hypothetical protein
MFCPKCSQQQASEEVRFCSRCGFPLSVIARVLEGDGQLVVLEEEGEGRGLTKRQRGMRKGLLIMAGGFTFGLFAILLTAYKEDFFPMLLLSALILVVGLMRMLYGMLLEEDAPQDRAERATRLQTQTTTALGGGRVRGAELPSGGGFSAAEFTPGRVQTAEMAEPSSVTENTTRLLEKDEG